METTGIEEDWMYFKQNEDDKWSIKYFRCQSPFLFIYKNEQLKREGKPELVLIINEYLEIHKTNDRICFCSFVKIKKKMKAQQYWSVITRDGYIIIGKLYHVDTNGNKIDRNSKKRKSIKNKALHKSKKSRTISIGFGDEFKQNMSKSSNKYDVIATKEHDEIETIYKWDITCVKVTYSQNDQIIIEEHPKSHTKLKFSNKKHALLFNQSIIKCMNNLQEYRENMSSFHPDITGVAKPLFPLTIYDTKYNKKYYFISLNQIGIEKWYKLLSPKPIESSIKPLINKLEMNDSSLVNLDEVDEIYDLISRDLHVNIIGSNTQNNYNAMQRIINLPMEKRLMIIHMNAISISFQGVHYWISILNAPKDPKHVLTLFLKHLDAQAVKKAKFIEQFVENDGLISLLSIQKQIKNDIMMSDGENNNVELRILLAKVFEIIGSALSYNEIIKENKATNHEKYKSIISKNNTRKISNDNIFDEEDDDDDIDQDEMKRLYGSDDSDISENKSNDIIVTSPTITSVKSPRSAVIGNAIQIRYKSGAEVIFDCEQKEEVIEYLVSNIWGFHETEILIDDLSPGIGVTKCLINLCLLKPEYAAFITTVLLELTDLGKENDNWWLPMVRTIENALIIYNECTADATLNVGQNMFIVQDKCRNYIRGLLTLVLTMIDSFEINDRIFERKLLDSILFDDLLYNLANAITDKQLHALIQLYKQSKQSDINEITYSQMEITQEFFDYLRDKTIENGFHQYLSNILTNLAAFPDDNEDVWKDVEQNVIQWRNKLDKLDREESITPEINGNHNENYIINVSLPEMIETDDNNNNNITDENMANINNFLMQSLNNKIENLETEKNELNSQYQSQLKQTNDLQELLKEYKDKISVLEHELKEKEQKLKEKEQQFKEKEQKLKENINNKNTKNGKNTSENNNKNIVINGNKEKNLTEEQSKRKEKQESEIREKKNKLEKYKRKKNISDKKEEIKQDIKNGNLPPLNEEEQKLVDGFKKQLKMRVPPPAVKHKIKYKEKKPHLLPYVFPEMAPVQSSPPKLPELNEKDKKELEKYKKLLKMKMPEPSVKLKMKRAKHNHLLPYLFPEMAPAQSTPKKLPELNEKDKKELEKYKKLLKMRMPEPSIKLKMKRAKHNHLIPYLFKDTTNNNTNNIPKSKLPSDVKEKPKIKPNVSMLPFHWDKIKEKVIKNTIWYNIYHKYGKFKENQIFELSKLDELFGKKEDPNKKSKNKNKNKNKTKNASSQQNIIPSEVMILDKKTRQKIEIFLNRVRMNWNMTRLKICDHIININDFGLTHDHIEKLINVSPNLKESQEFKRSIKQLNESDILGKAALFWRELLSVDFYIRDRLIVWEFKLTFKQLISEEEIKINILNECIYKIRNDNEFKRVLALALDIGNYVNGGKRQGQAYGFNILTLEKLDQFPRRRNKDGTPVPTMLEYIYILLKDKYTNHLLWIDNLDILNEATTIDLNVINANVKKFKGKVDLLHERIQSADETGFSGKNFVHKMTPFYKDAMGHLQKFEDSVENLNKELKQLAVWFDVDDDNLDFLKQINVFRKTFKLIGPRLEKRKKDAERKAKRDKKKQSGRGKGKNKKRGVKGGVAIIGLDRRESILRAVSKKPQLKLDLAGNLAPQWSKGSSASRSRGMSRGGLRNELWKFAASVENKVKVV